MKSQVFIFILFSSFTCLQVHACHPCVLKNDQIFFVMEEELQLFQNMVGCSDHWYGWHCCSCRSLNGSAFNSCQNCYMPKCGE